MKILILIAVFLLPHPAAASEHSRAWDVAVLAFADYRQSVELFSRSGYYELNPILNLLGKTATGDFREQQSLYLDLYPDNRHTPGRTELAAFGAIGVAAVWLLEQAGTPDIVLDSIVETERINVEMNNQVLNGEGRRIFYYVLNVKW